ncbi:hypothetical protein G7A66_11055 [Altererythrobacter sp. SALINAS58]|uniref:5-methylcytosine restriction system specificity protein McrC n=1 Tax=Alteripontixanthobacter muriae TaxID=2705546 RepID=UPI0019D6443A|nr:hypothetical protein [Alteripontixanthobacter muriae]NTZ43610.1 hypothetical protein [Alteripontixanthobacter muriae]
MGKQLAERRIMSIPIRNLYYIFCYAWAHFPGGEALEVGDDEAPDLQNLFAKLLIEGLHKIIRRGLARGYVELNEDLRTPRGRILLNEVIKRQTLLRGQAACRYDELQTDILHNQIVKATVRLLERSETLLSEYRHELGILARQLEAVSDIRLSPGVFRRVQISRHNRTYSMLMKLCEFVFQSALPEDGGTNARFADVLEDEIRMSAVFEDFLRNFYAHEQREYSVKRNNFLWDAVSLTETGSALLPIMQTDIMLRSEVRTIVADAKFYKETLRGHQNSSPKIRSNHLYQLFTYLHHARIKEPKKIIGGMLIYPSAGYHVQEDYEISGSHVRIATINLDLRWREIHAGLLDLLQKNPSPAKMVATEGRS